MKRCRECRAELPLGARFCFECGAAVTASDAAASAGQPPPKAESEDQSQTAPGGPEQDPGGEVEVLDERSRKRFLPPGTAVCRFCKGAIDLEGLFCEQCGAPVEEAVSPGLLKPRRAEASEPPVAITAAAETVLSPPAQPGPVVVQPAEPAVASPPAAKAAEWTEAAPAPPAVEPPPLPATVVIAPAQQRPPGPSAPNTVAPGAPLLSAEEAGILPPAPEAAETPVAPSPAATVVSPLPTSPAAERVPPQAAPAQAVPIPQIIYVSPPPRARGLQAKKLYQVLLLATVSTVILGILGVVAWDLLRPRHTASVSPPEQRTAVPAPAPPAGVNLPIVSAAPQLEEVSPQGAVPAETPLPGRRKKRLLKPAAAPAPPPANPKALEIASLESRARDAYTKGDFAEPAGANAIGLLKQALALDPNDGYAKSLMENSINGGKYKAQQAIFHKDFSHARQMAEAMIQLLPDRRDVAGLKEDIAAAERAEAAARQPKPAAPAVSFQAYHLHSEKAPAEDGPYCAGMLSVVSGRLVFTGQTASSGETPDHFDVPCSDIRAIKKNARVASHQSGFHVRTGTANLNFVPADSAPAHINALADACEK